MKAPAFWYRPGWSWLRVLLSPLSWLYSLVHALDWQFKSWRSKHAQLPVICIGNISIGGTGKTPVTDWLAGQVHASGYNPVVISRGYGGQEEGPVFVDTDRHTARDVGDEPLMLAARHSVIVARNRVAGAELAVRLGHDCILLDDGFQNPSLAKDLSLIVIDGKTGFGNGAILPAGPLRESVTAGLSRASAVIVTGTGAVPVDVGQMPCFKAALQPDMTDLDKDGRWLAFCGIGRPDKFFDMLLGLGFDLAKKQAFPDHHDYDSADLSALLAEAREQGWRLITTEKDAVKLPAALRRDIAVLPLRLDLDKGTELMAMVTAILPQKDTEHGASGT